ncbi:MAG: RNB domain-containing ribonuclease, partial [Treponema sp.]|nr:RNB domain-containing ribonuclease [Treponema sp.]
EPGNVALSESDRRFLQDVEMLALGKTDKSRTLKDLGKSETAEEAHRLLLACGAWTVWENPHPSRFALTRDSAKIVPLPPPDEKRLDLTGLAAYAIDNAWSSDPDDAVSLESGEGSDGGYTLWVHVSDPAASVLPGSPADIEARGRGATLYLPEGASRMLSEEALSLFALGIRGGISPALSFKVTLNPDCTIKETEIAPSLIRVTRLTYPEADSLIETASTAANADAVTLAALAVIAERNVERRLDTGAVMIELPETHVSVSLGGAENKVCVEPSHSYRSAALVRECMVLAGEGAARWALQRRLPFPYISQESGDLPEKRLDGIAGAWQLRRCMRPRSLSAKPGVHWGLGLDEYTQVTSPLRRYTDLLCHQQIRAWLNQNEGRGGDEPLSADEVLLRVSAAEAAAAATTRAERASRAHWLAVYLSQTLTTPERAWEAHVADRKGNRATVIIPALGVETQVNVRGGEKPNDTVSVKLVSVKIPEGEISFAQV